VKPSCGIILYDLVAGKFQTWYLIVFPEGSMQKLVTMSDIGFLFDQVSYVMTLIMA
jgi:hypothetical protein